MLECLRCPVCHTTPLPPGRKVCSRRCRTRQWRERETALRERLRTLRAYVDAELDVIIAELATARPNGRVADRGGTIHAYSQEL
jgi:predicted nucleic acid-binding Zn ribbon protein